MKHPFQLLNNVLHPMRDKATVTYILKGSSGDYNITYVDANGTAQEPHISKTWKKKLVAKEGDFVYFSAQSNNQNSDLKVKILLNGKIFKEADAKGDYAVATASGCITNHQKNNVL